MQRVGREHPATVVAVGRDDGGDVDDEGKGARGMVHVAGASCVARHQVYVSLSGRNVV